MLDCPFWATWNPCHRWRQGMAFRPNGLVDWWALDPSWCCSWRSSHPTESCGTATCSSTKEHWGLHARSTTSWSWWHQVCPDLHSAATKCSAHSFRLQPFTMAFGVSTTGQWTFDFWPDHPCALSRRPFLWRCVDASQCSQVSPSTSWHWPSTSPCSSQKICRCQHTTCCWSDMFLLAWCSTSRPCQNQMARTSQGSHGWGWWARQCFNLLDLPQDPTPALCSSPLPPWFPTDLQQRGGQSSWSQRSSTTSQVSWRDKVLGLEPLDSSTHWRHQWRRRNDLRSRGRWLCAWGQASSTCWTSRWSWRWWWLRTINCWWWSSWWWSTSRWWSSPVPWTYGTARRITFVPWTFGTAWWTFSVPWTYGTTSSNGWWTSSTSNVANQQQRRSGALSRSFSSNTSSWSSFRL